MAVGLLKRGLPIKEGVKAAVLEPLWHLKAVIIVSLFLDLRKILSLICLKMNKKRSIWLQKDYFPIRVIKSFN